jgi:hypothetical protein
MSFWDSHAHGERGHGTQTDALVIVAGTDDIATARTVYAKYVGN